MQSPAINTIVKMLETLPEPIQEQIANHLREYLAEMQDEAKWDESFKKTQKQLIIAAQQAKKEITGGQAIDYKPL